MRFVAHKPRLACLYMFLKHIFVLVFGTIHRTLFIGTIHRAWRDECAMFGLFEPSLVPWFGCILGLICMCACACVVSKNWLSVVGLNWVGFSLGLDQVGQVGLG